MFFIEEINKIIGENAYKKIAVFVDMDGVIADYRFGEGVKIRGNVKGVYLNKRRCIKNDKKIVCGGFCRFSNRYKKTIIGE